VPQLEGKVVWVTGGGSGIGEAAALALAREGAAIVLTGRREAPLEEVAARIRELGGTAHIQPGDLTEPRSVRRIGDFIKDEMGRLDILLNNAGININDRHWDKLTPENALLMINGNLAAAAQCVTVALPIMRLGQDGLIIHTASMAGRFIGGFPGPLYTAAKHGIVAMSHSINMQECVHPLLRLPARRGRDRDPRQAAEPGQRRRTRPHGATARLRRFDPLHRAPAEAPRDERGHAGPDLEPRLCRGDRKTFLTLTAFFAITGRVTQEGPQTTRCCRSTV
jgi:NADP-dependent 3-hydroxy acid dehydrogenase YdfG